jgi:hypothetical protein
MGVGTCYSCKLLDNFLRMGGHRRNGSNSRRRENLGEGDDVIPSWGWYKEDAWPQESPSPSLRFRLRREDASDSGHCVVKLKDEFLVGDA